MNTRRDFYLWGLLVVCPHNQAQTIDHPKGAADDTPSELYRGIKQLNALPISGCVSTKGKLSCIFRLLECSSWGNASYSINFYKEMDRTQADFVFEDGNHPPERPSGIWQSERKLISLSRESVKEQSESFEKILITKGDDKREGIAQNYDAPSYRFEWAKINNSCSFDRIRMDDDLDVWFNRIVENFKSLRRACFDHK